MVLEFGEPGPIAGYHILLIIHSEKLLHFPWITPQPQKKVFWQTFVRVYYESL